MGREVQPADEFLPPRLGGPVEREERRGRGIGAVGVDGAVERGGVRAEPVEEEREEGEAAVGVELGPAGEDGVAIAMPDASPLPERSESHMVSRSVRPVPCARGLNGRNCRPRSAIDWRSSPR